MAAKLMTAGGPKFGTYLSQTRDMFLPSLIIFGPSMMLMGLSHGLISGVNNPGWAATTGTLMLIFGLLALYSKQRHIEKRLEELERMKN